MLQSLMLDRLDDEACPWQGYKALCVGVIWWLGLALFPFHLLLVFSSRDAGYGGHRVQRVWSIRGRYGLYGPLHTLHPRCVHGIVKRLYGAAAGMRTLGEWALYCDWTGHSVALLSLIPVTALIPRYPSLSPRHTRQSIHFFHSLVLVPRYLVHFEDLIQRLHYWWFLHLALWEVLEEVVLHQRLLDQRPRAEVFAVLCHLHTKSSRLYRTHKSKWSRLWWKLRRWW